MSLKIRRNIVKIKRSAIQTDQDVETQRMQFFASSFQ